VLVLVLVVGVFGVVMFAKPWAGALALLAPISAYALISAIAELTVALGGTRTFSRALGGYDPSTSP
jgi:uncharacterized membrane protein HdeD (DUF308 family)